MLYKKIAVCSFVLISILSMFSCAKGGIRKEAAFAGAGPAERLSSAKKAVSERDTSFTESNQSENSSMLERKLIKEGHVHFETGSIQDSRQRLEILLKKYRAYIGEEDEHSSSQSIYYNVTVRVPKEYFDIFLAELIDGIKKVDSKTIDIQDVTEEFIDITARLKVKKETEIGYLRLLQQAKTVKDILDIQNQIQYLRSDIESIEGRLRYLENAVNFSTLHLRMYQRIEAGSVFSPLTEALKEGAYLFADFCLAVLYGWPFLLMGCVLVTAFLRIRKHRRNRRNST